MVMYNDELYWNSLHSVQIGKGLGIAQQAKTSIWTLLAR